MELIFLTVAVVYIMFKVDRIASRQIKIREQQSEVHKVVIKEETKKEETRSPDDLIALRRALVLVRKLEKEMDEEAFEELKAILAKSESKISDDYLDIFECTDLEELSEWSSSFEYYNDPVTGMTSMEMERKFGYTENHKLEVRGLDKLEMHIRGYANCEMTGVVRSSLDGYLGIIEPKEETNEEDLYDKDLLSNRLNSLMKNLLEKQSSIKFDKNKIEAVEMKAVRPDECSYSNGLRGTIKYRLWENKNIYLNIQFSTFFAYFSVSLYEEKVIKLRHGDTTIRRYYNIVETTQGNDLANSLVNNFGEYIKDDYMTAYDSNTLLYILDHSIGGISNGAAKGMMGIRD